MLTKADQKYSKTVMFEILLQFKVTVFHFNISEIVFIPVMEKLDFQQPLLQSSVSHDSSEIILITLIWCLKKYLFSYFFYWPQTFERWFNKGM